jgi:hypothetical protein
MSTEAERIEELRCQLEALRVHVHSVPLEQLESIINMEVGYELGVIHTHLEKSADGQHLARAPLQEATREIDRWLKPEDPQQHPMDPDHFDRMVGNVSTALERAEQLAKVTGSMEQLSSLNAKVFDHLAAGDATKAHGLIRQMIDLLQGASRQVRGLEHEGPER